MIENKELKSKDEVIKTIETQEKGIPKAQTIPNEKEKLKETTIGQLLEAESTTNKISHQKAQTTKEVKISPPANSSQEKSQRYQNQKRQNPRQRERQNNRKSNQRPKEFEEKVVNISRVTNVVKGGRRFSFSVLVVIGDKKGRVAQGHGKAKEVPEAIKKAIKDAKRNLIKVPIVDGRTIPHIIQAKFVSSKILLKPATKGRGIIASGVVRSVVELAGYHDIVTKSLGSSNKTNAVKATLKALSTLKTAKEISDLRS